MNYQVAIRGEQLTLPSIEGGFGTLNIARDPPKSYFTKYKPKVFDTNLLTEMIDASGDRACESILKFGRGRNPMVSVSYSNNGSNGGQYRFGSGNSSDTAPLTFSGSAQAYLPYRVMREGAFRPPIIPPEQLLPLSRQPRHLTSQFSNKGSNAMRQDDLTKCDAKTLKSLRTNLLHSYVEGRASVTIELPSVKPRDVDNMIRDKRNYFVDTNKREIKGMNAQQFGGNQFIRVQDRMKGALSTNTRGMETNAMHSSQEKVFTRNIPNGAMYTNTSQKGVDLNPFLCGTTYTNLAPRSSRGGVDNMGFQPSTTRQGDTVQLKAKSLLQKASILERASQN
jgi:hypothetical protein